MKGHEDQQKPDDFHKNDKSEFLRIVPSRRPFIT